MNDSVIAAGSPSEMQRALAPYAGAEIAGDASLYPAWSQGGFQELPHPSRILNERSEIPTSSRSWCRWWWSGWLGELYDQMLEADTDLAGLWAKREKALLALPRYIVPADSSPEAAETAGFAMAARSLIPQWTTNIVHNLGAVGRGVAFSELIWERLERGPLTGAWVPVDVIDRPMGRFTFDAKTRSLFVRRAAAAPLLVPPGKVLRFTYGTKDNPWGRGIFDQVYWFWYIKKHCSKYWAVFVERFASPLGVGKYKHKQSDDTPSGAASGWNLQQQQLLLEVLETIRTGRSIVIPEGLDIAYLEASRGGDSTYQGFINWLTRGMALILLGEIDTSGLAKGPGSFAKSAVSNEVRLETVAHDANLLGTFESDTLLRWLIAVNFGPDAPIPKAVYDAMDAGDRAVRMDGIDRALAAGQAVPVRYARMTWQVPLPREGEEVVEGRAAAAQVPPPPPPVPAEAAEETVLEEEQDPDPPELSAPPSLQLAEEDLADLGAPVEVLDSGLQEVVESFAADAVEYFTRQQGRLVELWEAGDREAILQTLVRGERPDLQAELLETAQIHGAGLGLRAIDFEFNEKEGVFRRLYREWFGSRSRTSIDLATPPGMLDARTPATALELWARLLGIPKEIFVQLIDGFRRLALAVAGLTEASMLTEVHSLLGRALGEGLDRRGFRDALDELYASKGLSPTSPHHADLVFANNTRQAAHNVRWKQTVGNPAAHRLIPYLAVWTIADQRVREREAHNHAVVHGKIFAIGHAFWETWWPIYGHNCRCGVATINLAEARRRGLTGAEPTGPWPLDPKTGDPALPDPGFRGRPRLDLLTQDFTNRALRLRDQARDDGATDLFEALTSLFKLLGIFAEGGSPS